MQENWRMINVFILSCLLSVCDGFCSDFSGARSAALGGASVALSDFWSLADNQAGLVGCSAISVGTSFENRFLLMETGIARFGVIVPLHRNALAVSLRHYGYSVFRQLEVGLAFARSFGGKVNVGIQLDYLNSSMTDGYGSNEGITFEAGIQVQPTDQLTFGAHWFNPFSISYFRVAGERACSIYTMGLKYGFTQHVFFCMEMEKDSDFKPALKMGLEYEFTGIAAVRMGYSTVPAGSGSGKYSLASLVTLGFGLVVSRVQMDFGASLHTSLGWSPAVSICYGFGNEG